MPGLVAKAPLPTFQAAGAIVIPETRTRTEAMPFFEAPEAPVGPELRASVLALEQLAPARSLWPIAVAVTSAAFLLGLLGLALLRVSGTEREPPIAVPLRVTVEVPAAPEGRAPEGPAPTASAMPPPSPRPVAVWRPAVPRPVEVPPPAPPPPAATTTAEIVAPRASASAPAPMAPPARPRFDVEDP